MSWRLTQWMQSQGQRMGESDALERKWGGDGPQSSSCSVKVKGGVFLQQTKCCFLIRPSLSLSVCVCSYAASMSTKEMTMGKKPTTQTTATASLTKSSREACSLTSPAKSASKSWRRADESSRADILSIAHASVLA